MIADVEKDLLTPSARFRMYIGSEREGKFASDSRNIEPYSVKEFEDVTVYALFDLGFFVFQQPRLRTRLYTPKRLVQQCACFIEYAFVERGISPFSLHEPKHARDRLWFIQRLLEVAQNPDSRITEVKVTHLHDSHLSSDLTIFNPDYSLEEIGRVFMPRANLGISESTHKAEEGNDLAKNPLVRAQVGAGHPERMIVKTAPKEGRKRERKVTYDAAEGALINVSVPTRRPGLPDIIHMLREEFHLAYAK